MTRTGGGYTFRGNRYSPFYNFRIVPEYPLMADSVEKVALLSGLRQNPCIGQHGSILHDGAVIEWAGTLLLLVQP